MEEKDKHKKKDALLNKSEEYYQTLLDTIPHGIQEIDTSGSIIFVNKAYNRIFGYEEGEAIGKSMLDKLIHDLEREKLRDYLKTLVKDQPPPIPYFEKNRTKEGRIIDVQVDWNYKRDEKGRVIGFISVITDITEHEQAQKEIRETKNYLENIFKTSVDGILVTDNQGVITMLNGAVEKMVGYTKDELIGKHSRELSPPEKEYREEGRDFVHALYKKGTIVGRERIWSRKDGNLIAVEHSVALLKDKAGRPTGTIGSVKEITDRKRAEEKLRRSEEKYRSLIEYANDAIISINKDGYIVGFNKQAEKLFGYSQKEIIEKPITLLILPSQREKEQKALERIVVHPKTGLLESQRETKIQKKDGQEIPVEVSYYSLALQDEYIITGVVRDISERKEAEEKLIHNQEQLRSLASQLTKVEEQERRSIASYLHDHLGQELFAIKLHLEKLKKSLPSNHTIKILESVIESVNQMMGDMRSMSYELSPPILYELGLIAALQWIVEEMRTLRNINITFNDDGQLKPLEATTNVLLFQAVRELLNNITRHAKAQNVEVFVARDNAMVVIQVNDDGIGFEGAEVDASREKNQGFGLYSIKERVRYIGGDLDIESALNRGSRITLKAPLKS